MNVLLAHPGTQHSFRLASELERHNALAGFYTGMAIRGGGLADRAARCLPARWQRKLANRRLRDVPARKLYRRPRAELAAMWKSRRPASDGQRIWHKRAAAFQRSIPDRALRAASAVIGFDTAAWILAERCAELKVPMILDQSTPHPDSKIAPYELVQRQYPAWSEGVETRRPEVRAAEQQEHDAAARIVAASTFTRQSLVDHGVDPAKIRVNPYGVDCERFAVQPRAGLRPLRFLFVGLVNARKGVPLLLDAWRKIQAARAELWIVGRASAPVQALLPELPGLKFVGPVPHAEVAELMQQCDVFVFPSYFEGFGLVLLEAMASGLPVITTTATAGPDLLTGGEGWIVAPGELEGLAGAMTVCLEHPRRVREMGMAAREKALQFTWSAYGDRWMEILTDLSG